MICYCLFFTTELLSQRGSVVRANFNYQGTDYASLRSVKSAPALFIVLNQCRSVVYN